MEAIQQLLTTAIPTYSNNRLSKKFSVYCCNESLQPSPKTLYRELN